MQSILIGFGGLILIIFLWMVTTYNRLKRLQLLVRESWSQVDVALKRRYDLVPNLVETVKAYAAHEQQTLERVIEARNRAISADGANAQIPAEAALVGALNGLFMRAEAYPNLRASENFLALQQELANTEDRIAAARRFYNSNVRDYNIIQEQFPSSLMASGHSPAQFFEVESLEMRAAPQVRLT